ncbi:MAG: Methylenetetrahydrofolate--tRNA-(uracil-5-)-methyltransferase TrmFO [Syntrophorhabdus sp. PtaU1.Bin058]|nr:MAG: Methylenetetrahydrofolate--tRNA-(uracil-5-)-methyltransferase TrmFO [Syntrophorhabdus sp. PtaU1.Bin058]
MEIKIIGGGLAGAEAAYQIARRGGDVILYEMRPSVFTPAHKTSYLSELVCSNSLKSTEFTNAHGLLKEELRRLGSIIIRIADETSIPGGKALVVDREVFSRRITDEIESNPRITVVRKEIGEIPEGIVIIATGPLTSNDLTEGIKARTGVHNLYFYDAISPIIDGDSIDMDKAFFGSRYRKDAVDYLNCPLTEKEYDTFYEELTHAGRVDLKDFEDVPYFEGCLPIEVMAERGKKTLLYGPMKPVGLEDRRVANSPCAVIQLRRENEEGTMYNMVGFQTKLTYREQERVFGLVPALRNAVFLRYGSIHRNTYINAPKLLNERLQLRDDERVLFAGQITGVEGYVESTASGLVAGLSAHAAATGRAFSPPPEDTCTGSLVRYVTTETDNFQPMNINFGLLRGYNKRQKEKAVAHALESIEKWRETVDSE